jgi:hypothetical protein
MLTFHRAAHGRVDRVGLEVTTLVVAGWTGRDMAGVQHHIDELAAIGVPAPSTVPVYYRGAASIVTQTTRLQVLGPATSGEAEPVLVAFADGVWLGVGSDHTDREAEAAGIARSKQLCGKVLGHNLWRLDDVLAHWDELILSSHIVEETGTSVRYQHGPLAAMRRPEELMTGWAGDHGLPAGTAMFLGTLGAIGGIRPAQRFTMELTDPVLKRSLAHTYDIEVLPIVS